VTSWIIRFLSQEVFILSRKNSFFSRWGKGIKDYSNSQKGELESKLYFYGFVLVGLFGAGFQYFSSDNIMMSFVMWGVMGIMFFDFRRVWRSRKLLSKEYDIFEGEK